jgi:hypothetical protein
MAYSTLGGNRNPFSKTLAGYDLHVKLYAGTTDPDAVSHEDIAGTLQMIGTLRATPVPCRQYKAFQKPPSGTDVLIL